MLELLYSTLLAKSYRLLLTAKFSRKESVPTRGEIQSLDTAIKLTHKIFLDLVIPLR